MSRMAWIGFDYDYTLAKYTSDLLPWYARALTALPNPGPEDQTLSSFLPHRIYNWLKRELVQKSGYPDLLLRRHYDPDFAVRSRALHRGLQPPARFMPCFRSEASLLTSATASSSSRRVPHLDLPCSVV